MKRLKCLLLAFCCLSLILINCGEDKPTGPKDTYSPTKHTGYWIGTTSQNRPITFRVNEEGKIDSLVVQIRMSLGQSTCTTDFFSKDGSFIIEDDEFFTTIKPDTSMGNILPRSFLTGNFTSIDSVSGEYDGYTGSFSLTCGNQFIMGTGTLFSEGTWAAYKNIMVVSIESPSNKEIISGTMNINVTVNSFYEISKVEFYINDTIQFTDTSLPYSYSWNTTQYNDSSYTIKVIAYDTENRTASDQCVVTVNNTPSVSITSPSDNSVIYGTIDINADIVSIDGISKVEFYIDDTIQFTDTSSPYNYSWDTTPFNDSLYTIKVIAYDAENRTACDQCVVTVNNTPSVSITSPIDSSVIKGNVDIVASFSTNNEVSKVEFYINDTIEFTDISSPYSYIWDTKLYSNGTYTIKVVAYGINNESSYDEIEVNVSNPKWEFLAEGPIKSSPAIGSDGIIYINSSYPDNKLYAINPDGTKKWEFGNSDITSPPSIDENGVIYVGSSEGKLYAIKPNGTKKWEFLVDNRIVINKSAVRSCPAIGKNGTVYFGSSNGFIYAVKSNSDNEWSWGTLVPGMLIGDPIYSSPAVGSDGIIYVGTGFGGNKLIAINPDGTIKWQFETGNIVDSSPALGSDGTIYVGSSDDKLYAINPEGIKKWEFELGGYANSSPVIDSDGTIYIGADYPNYKLFAINPDGTKKWEFETDGSINASPAIGSDGIIYVGSSDYKLYAINPDGTKNWEFLTDGSIESSPAIGSDGTIYVGSSDYKLYAIEGSESLADSPWPMFHHDLRHTGRKE